MEESLLIIGNGFDLAHGMKSGFKDFRNRLITSYELDEKEIWNREFFCLPVFNTNYKDQEEYDEHAFAFLFVNLIDNANHLDIEWKDFEESLADINWKEILEENVYAAYDEEGDYNPWETENNYSNIGNLLVDSSHILKHFFTAWVNRLEENLPTERLNKFRNIGKINYFLSFNYTSTLETLYEIKNVTHIHGYIKKFEKPIFGHNSNEYIELDNIPEKYEANNCLKKSLNLIGKKVQPF